MTVLEKSNTVYVFLSFMEDDHIGFHSHNLTYSNDLHFVKVASYKHLELLFF
jgi:acyl-CoA thioesterase